MIFNVLYCLIELGAIKTAQKNLEKLCVLPYFEQEQLVSISLIKILLAIHTKPLKEVLSAILQLPQKNFTSEEERTILHFMRQALLTEQPKLVHELYDSLTEQGVQ